MRLLEKTGLRIRQRPCRPGLHRMPVILVVTMAVLPVLCSWAGDSAPFPQLQADIARLIALQKATYSAVSDWEVQKMQLDARTELLERQIVRLQSEFERTQKRRETRTEQRARLQHELAESRSVLLNCATSLGDTEDYLKVMGKRLPEPFLAGLGTSLGDLPGKEAPITVDNLGPRLQQVLTVLTEIRQFDSGIHLVKEILTPPDGRRQEMDVLYIGLGTAFAVSRDQDHAARASANPDGWEWEWNPEWASPIRQSIDIHRKEKPAAFIPLPLRLEGGAK